VRAAGIVVWLRVTPQCAARRVEASEEARPLWPGARDREDEATRLAARREATWRAAAHAEADAEAAPDHVVEAVGRSWMRSQSHPG
jgi:shikimate kinase